MSSHLVRLSGWQRCWDEYWTRRCLSSLGVLTLRGLPVLGGALRDVLYAARNQVGKNCLVPALWDLDVELEQPRGAGGGRSLRKLTVRTIAAPSNIPRSAIVPGNNLEVARKNRDGARVTYVTSPVVDGVVSQALGLCIHRQRLYHAVAVDLRQPVCRKVVLPPVTGRQVADPERIAGIAGIGVRDLRGRSQDASRRRSGSSTTHLC